MIRTVVVTRRAQKGLDHAPQQVNAKFLLWMDAVENDGLEEVRRIPGYHDEPLKGVRKGQRSVRLNRSWRAIYVVLSNGDIEFVSVEEVSNHDY
jgi:toxin HigB-1